MPERRGDGGEPFATLHDEGSPLVAELSAAGFADAEEIGRGGFGVVYRCTQVQLDRVVAVKVLTADLDEHRPRFIREQQAMARLTGHPNIVAVLQVGETPSGYPFLVMPYLRRGCLHERIRRLGLLPVDEVLLVGVKMAGALETAHRTGIVHRDLKPANILLTDYGQPALTDFGIAHMPGAFKTAAGYFTGTPAFTAPEVLSGDQPSSASDTYGLGATLFSALTGHAAFERRSGEEVVAQFVRIATAPVPDLRERGIPADVSAVIERAMSRDPDERPSAFEFGQVLQQLQTDRGLAVDDMALQGSDISDRLAEPAVLQTSVRSSARRLMAPLTRIVGRHREVAELKNLLSTSRLVTLTGIGGVGKTTLATHVAREQSARFGDRIWQVELAELRDDTLLPEVVAAALGVGDQSARPLMDVVADFLYDREALLVLDNCEHLIDAAAELAERLLGYCPQVHILATSREILGIEGESVLPLAPLPCPDHDRDPTLTGLAEYDAVALFVERARAAVPGFTLTRLNASAISRICSQLDGLPLALELAAARLRAMSLHQIGDGLSDRYALLKHGRRTAPPRQQTLAMCVRWSYDLCTATERHLWAQLSVFAGSFDLPAARHVCGQGVRADEFLDRLSALVDKSILIRTEHDDAVRFRLLETLRDYGKTRMTEEADYAPLARRHADWYQRLADDAAAEWLSPKQVDWIRHLSREMPNIREALKFNLDDSPAAALQMTAAMRPKWLAGGMYSEARRWLDLALAATPPEPSAYRIRALCAAVLFAGAQGDVAAAASRVSEARSHLNAAADPADHGLVNWIEGYSAMLSGEYPHAQHCLADALSISDDPEVQVSAMYFVGLALSASGEIDQALDWFEKALALMESLGETVLRSRVLASFGLACCVHGEFERAERLLRQGLQLSHVVDDPYNGAHCLEFLGWTAGADNNARRATVLMAAAAETSRAIGTQLIGLTGFERFHHECELRAREQLGAAGFEAAWHEGSALTFDRAVDVACDQTVDVACAQTPSEDATLVGRLDELTGHA